ncbi:MAG: hypothetical protein KME15_27085 [Drouetiella hepatica Uher 2000/2452]|uniref:Uncharacterized protein n=1 Tax=Drouetiella hepatica Uher 2000/2452 TaxID=904376 RepID=A0A951QHT3_9CYAN|nr:hypothetical protein [Drouetiella hepatica Uher 2000/2452]
MGHDSYSTGNKDWRKIQGYELNRLDPSVYRLRYFFDSGAGICLWAANDVTRDRLGYTVDSSKLPITSTLMHRVEFVLAWYDTFLDWDNPPRETQWKAIEGERFNLAAQEVLHLLREQLGAEFEIVDESKTAA